MRMLSKLGVAVVCEGVETVGELDALRDAGVTLFQGYLFAKPKFEGLPDYWLPAASQRGI